MLSNISIYKEKYEPNKIYWSRYSTSFVSMPLDNGSCVVGRGTSFALMTLDDGSYVVGKGTNMPVAYSSNVDKADAEVESLRRRFLNKANKFEESLRFENFTDLQRFIWGRKKYIRKNAVLLDFPKKIYVGSNKWRINFCVVNTGVEVPDGYIYLNYLDHIYNKDLIKIPVIDFWTGFRMSLEEFNKVYREYDGEFTYSAEADSKKASTEDAVTILSDTFSDADLQRLLEVQDIDIDKLIQECRVDLFKYLSGRILNGKIEPSQLANEGFIKNFYESNKIDSSDLQQLIMLYGIKQSLSK